MAAALFGAGLSSAPAAWAEEIPQRIQVDDARPISSSTGAIQPRLEWRNRRERRVTIPTDTSAQNTHTEPAPKETARIEPAPLEAKHVDSQVVQAVSVKEITDADTVELNGPQVRPAADIKTIKPIEDPFGDRRAPHVAQRPGASVMAPPMRVPAKVAQEPPGGAFQPNPIRSGQPAPAAPSLEPGGLAPPATEPGDLNPPMPAKQSNPFDDLPPRPSTPDPTDIQPVQPAPRPGTQLPPPRSSVKQPPREEVPAEPAPAGGADKADCDKVFNNRNCCSEGEECHRAWTRLNEARIDHISLDIAASYRPDINDRAEVLEKQKEGLLKVPNHVYTDRAKQVIAEGQLSNLTNGFVSITSNDGQVKRVRFNDLSNDDLCFVAAYWGVPNECHLSDEQFAGRCWTASTMTWKASALCHKPLYFEEVQLERYGHDAGPIAQPFLSAAHFFLTIPVLPYEMGVAPPNECQYALGYYRPGSCAPWMVPAIPLSARGAAFEAGAALGLIYILP